MKRKILSTLIGTLILSCAIAQDGSNIKYYEPNNLDSTLVGKFCHVDFGNESFQGQAIDTIQINVKGQQMKFYEHREDTGFNNWFNKQYLIRLKGENQLSTRLQNSTIDSLSSDKIFVTSTLSYYSNESPIETITVFQHWYERKDISKVLIKN
ncbi:hypothetical protein FEE95_15110 [Maribacter algarum]|uniref:Uncharacterized protein n=1 Tax=Maribacter algarum (ex Zhang et al. 2020) TaxID=2578118 RepID=A0A5S3PTF9_9FLAO|nr:hypothetical protein [Maribacter algarum]TMM55970.1 hypothetical protein FEE95_15110 [Maribacter algarum]